MTSAQLAYRDYLQSEHWKKLRAEAFRVLGRICCRCQSTRHVEPHHFRYRTPWESCTVADLIVVCYRCHRRQHGIVLPLSPKPFKKAVKLNPRQKHKAQRASVAESSRPGNSHFLIFPDQNSTITRRTQRHNLTPERNPASAPCIPRSGLNAARSDGEIAPRNDDTDVGSPSGLKMEAQSGDDPGGRHSCKTARLRKALSVQ